VVEGGVQWYTVHLFCSCMILNGSDEDSEVPWARNEMIPLSDDKAMELMDSHLCHPKGESPE